MSNATEFHNNTIHTVKNQLSMLNLILLLGIVIVFMLVVRMLYDVLDYLPQTSLLMIVVMLAVQSAIVFMISGRISTKAINAIAEYGNRLGKLLSASREIHEEGYSDLVMKSLINTAMDLTNADGGALLMVQDNGIVLGNACGSIPEVLIGRSFPLSDGIAGSVIASGLPVIIADATQDAKYTYDVDDVIRDGARSVLSVPFTLNGKTAGTIELVKKEASYFDAADLELLEYFTEHATLSMQQSMHNEDIRNCRAHMTNLLVEAIDLVTKKPGHARRTAKYCLMIGRALNMNEEDLSNLYTASLLHDVGCLKTFRKGGMHPEQQEQWSILGYKMLEGNNLLARSAPFVLHCRESFDGRGVPMGLSGRVIPLNSRIIHIAESFDDAVTMASVPAIGADRNTGTGGFEHAIRVLISNAGKRLDPKLVGLFIESVSVFDLESDMLDAHEVINA
jgi:response regulator RpfG family c-di-GMP phosphodiesterase